MADGFSLDDIREGVKEKAELSSNARARSVDGSNVDTRKPFTFEQEDYDRTEAPKDDMRDYWRKFETTPIIRKPITSFASRVTEPGYYIEAEGLNREQVKELGDWLDECAIIEGQPSKDFRLLAKKAIIQREVRGTALIEKAPHESDDSRIAGMKLINPETVEAVTRPNQTILMAPEDIKEYPEAPEAESGGAAAWLQDILETDQTTAFGVEVYSDDDGDRKIGFQRDEIVPLTRDADVGEVFGTSRIEAVAPRIEGLKQKLEDNDEAIASKAYPLWMFMFGSEESPWNSEDINRFMKSHEMENFHPGMKQGVRGDVDVETISGEVAEIAEYLQFDIQWILSSMPMPQFLLGSFGQRSVGQIAGVAQQQDVIRQIEEARMELEEEFTPVIREVAEQKGFAEENIKNIRVKFGEPGQPDPEVTRSQQVIRYVSDAQGGNTEDPSQQPQPQQQGQGQGQQVVGQPGPGAGQKEKQPDGIIEKGETPSSVDKPPDQKIAGVDEDANPYVDIKTGEAASVWDESIPLSPKQYEELAKADTVGGENREQISRDIEQVFLNSRDALLKTIEKRYEASPNYASVEYEQIANRVLDRAVSGANLQQSSRNTLNEELGEVAAEYGNTRTPFTQSQNARFFAQNVVNATRDAAEEMLRRARVHIRNAVASGEKWSEVRQRVKQEFTDDSLSQRANLIAHMEMKNAIETTKLQQFEAADDIVGVRVRNDSPSVPVTTSLNGVEVYFEDGDIDAQLSEHVDNSTLRQGFSPLPPTPPYHFNDTTTLEPIYGESNTEEQEGLSEELMTENIRRAEEVRQKQEQLLDELLEQ